MSTPAAAPREPGSLTEEELLALPIGAIVDGWDIDGNRLYLFVKIPDRNLVQTIIIDRSGWPPRRR